MISEERIVSNVLAGFYLAVFFLLFCLFYVQPEINAYRASGFAPPQASLPTEHNLIEMVRAGKSLIGFFVATSILGLVLERFHHHRKAFQ